MSHEWEPTEADKRGGWTLNMKWLESVQAKIPNDDGQDVSLETVESVLLAAGFPVSPEAHAEAGVFYLDRLEDEGGVSGTGRVAQGFVFQDGTVALRWLTSHTSTAIYASVAEVEAIHGHNGKTKLTRPAPAANTEGLKDALKAEIERLAIHSISVGPMNGPMKPERAILLEWALKAIDATLRSAKEGK